MTSKRGHAGFVKLLRHVRPHPRSGFDFEGTLLRSGRVVTLDDLRPAGYPALPVLLECSGIVKPGRGHNRSEYQYLIWQLDAALEKWLELARCTSRSWDWAVSLAAIAHGAVESQLQPVDLDSLALQIREYLDRELERVDASDRVRLLGAIHDELALRLSGAGGWVPSVPSHTHLPDSLFITSTQFRAGSPPY